MSQPAESDRRRQPLSVFSTSFALTIAALWGGNAVATSFALDVMPPIAVAAVRFVLAAFFMLLWCRIEGAGIGLRREQIWPSFVLGTLLFLQIGTFNYGVMLSNSSHGVLLVNTVAIWVLLIEHFITHTDRITRPKLAGLLLALCGAVAVLATRQQTTANVKAPTLAGDLILVLSSALLGVKVLYTRHAVKLVEPGKLILWHDIFGVLLFTLVSLAIEPIEVKRVDMPAILAFLYNGFVVGGACYAGQAWLLNRHTASQIAIFNFASPLFGVLAAWLLRHEPLSPWLIFAALCVAGGIALVNLRKNGASEQP